MNCCCRKRQQHLQAYYSTLTKTHTCVHRDRTDRLTERHRLTNTKQRSQRCTWKTVGWIFHQISDCTWPYLSDALWKKISTTSSCSAYVHFPMKLDQYSVLSSSLTDYGWTHDNCTVLFWLDCENLRRILNMIWDWWGKQSAKLISLFKVNGTCKVYLLKRFRDAQLISALNF